MYKLHGRKQLDFRNHLFVDAFRYIGDSGKLTGRIEKDDFQCHAEIQYEKVDDYMMAYISHSVIS